MAFGMDPEVKRYFKKIIRSLVAGLMWMMVSITAGIYFELAYSERYPSIVHILFYAGMAITLCLLLWYLYIIWKKK